MHKPYITWKCLAVGVLVYAGFAVGPAQATALYDTVVSATLTVESITNTTTDGALDELLIEGEALVFDSDTFADGDATADADGAAFPEVLTVLGEGDAIDLLALAFGDAGATGGEGAADSFFFTEGAVFLDNASSTDTFEVEFSFDYAAAASALADDLLSEFAFSLATLSLESTTQDAFIVDEIIEADTGLGLPGDLVSDSIMFTLTIAPDSGESLFVLADAEGVAEAEEAIDVNAPTGLTLLGLGVILMGAMRKRQ